MLEPDQMAVINVGKWDISKEIVSMMEISPWMVGKNQEGQASGDSYDPVEGKWMTNLVATTPITAKAMQN